MLSVLLVGPRSGADEIIASGDGSNEVVMATGADNFPNRTASDWVTYADHVVVVTAVSDRALPPDTAAQKNREGYIPRKATLTVDGIIWSRDDPRHAAPEDSFGWYAWGWAWHDGERTPMAMRDAPRVEVGHTYIMALAWQPGFEEGGEHVQGQWDALGSDAIIPYDDGVVGKGELEGQERSAAPSVSASNPNFSLEDKMAGKSADALTAALRSAKPERREFFVHVDVDETAVVTLAEYERIENGMTLAEVEEIIGGKGNSAEKGVYAWRGDEGGRAIIVFEQGSVIHKKELLRH